MQLLKQLFFSLFLLTTSLLCAQEAFEMNDIFSLQYANDIQISPDGEHIVYRRMGYDIMGDKSTGSLWIMNADGSQHQKLTSRDQNESSPRWSPNGKKLAFVSAGKKRRRGLYLLDGFEQFCPHESITTEPFFLNLVSRRYAIGFQHVCPLACTRNRQNSPSNPRVPSGRQNHGLPTE